MTFDRKPLRLLVLSDLHLEMSNWSLPERLPEFDVAVFAGDVDRPMTNGVRWLARQPQLYGKVVVYVMGNHEVYRFDVDVEPEEAKREAREHGIEVLDMSTLVVGDVRFLGATLWTDYAAHGTPKASMKAARLAMNDHRLVKKGASFMRPEDAAETHAKHLAWLRTEAAKPFAGRTVVVTHHLPSLRSVAQRWLGHEVTPAFASDLDDVIREIQADLWVHGHTHDSSDYLIGKTRMLCNPKGYGPKEPGGPFENDRAFVENLVVEV